MIAPFWANLTATWQAAMRPPIVFIGGGVLALMAIVLAAGLLWRKPNAVSAPGTTPDSLRLVDPKAGPTPTLTASAVKSLALRAADGVGCAWLDLDMEPPGAHGYQISLSGVAADAAAASTAISRALHGAGVNAEVTADGVHALQPQACPVIDALRASRQPHDEAPLISTAAAALDSTGAVYHLENRPSGCDLLPEPRQARIVASIDVGQASDFTLIGVEANGKLQQLIPSRSVFDQYIKSEPKYYQRLGRGKLQFTPCIDEVTARSTPEGLSGLLLVAGRGPFGLAPLNDKDSKAMPANWPAKFQTSAAARNWKSQIAWFRVEP